MEVGGGMMLQWSLRQGDAGGVITGWKTEARVVEEKWIAQDASRRRRNTCPYSRVHTRGDQW